MPNTRSPRSLRAHVDAIARVLRGLDPAEVQLSEVTDLYATFCRIERLGSSGRLLLLERVAQTPGVTGSGAGSAAEELANRAGKSVGQTRAELAASKHLGRAHRTAEAVRQGELSAEQATAIADAAVVNPSAEAELIERAQRESLKNTRDAAARAKAAGDDQAERERRIHRNRRARCWVRDGQWNLFASGTISEGAEIQQVLDRLVDARFSPPNREPDPSKRLPREAHAWDALLDVCRAAARGGSDESGGGEGSGAAAATRRREPLKRMMMIRVDLAALVRGALEPGEVCAIDGVGSISIDEARSLMGECIFKAVITNGQAVADVVHLGRGASLAQQIALLWQTDACSAEGCNRTVGIQNDHRVDWRHTRHTTLRELDNLCTHCHGLKTRAGWALVVGVGRRAFVPPGDARHPGIGPPGPSAPPGPPGPPAAHRRGAQPGAAEPISLFDTG